MKNFIFYFVLYFPVSGSLFFACEKDQENVSYNLEGEWKVVAFTDHTADDRTTVRYDSGDSKSVADEISLSFTNTNIGQGEVKRTSVSDEYFGKYNHTGKGVIAFSNINWTSIPESEWGRKFRSIAHAESYVVINNTELVIYSNQGRNSVTFKRIR